MRFNTKVKQVLAIPAAAALLFTGVAGASAIDLPELPDATSASTGQESEAPDVDAIIEDSQADISESSSEDNCVGTQEADGECDADDVWPTVPLLSYDVTPRLSPQQGIQGDKTALDVDVKLRNGNPADEEDAIQVSFPEANEAGLQHIVGEDIHDEDLLTYDLEANNPNKTISNTFIVTSNPAEDVVVPIDIKVGNLDCVGTQETGGKCDLPDGMNDGPKRFAESRIFFTIKHHETDGPGDVFPSLPLLNYDVTPSLTTAQGTQGDKTQLDVDVKLRNGNPVDEKGAIQVSFPEANEAGLQHIVDGNIHNEDSLSYDLEKDNPNKTISNTFIVTSNPDEDVVVPIDIKVGDQECVGTQEAGGECDLKDSPKFAESRIFFTIKHHETDGPGDVFPSLPLLSYDVTPRLSPQQGIQGDKTALDVDVKLRNGNPADEEDAIQVSFPEANEAGLQHIVGEDIHDEDLLTYDLEANNPNKTISNTFIVTSNPAEDVVVPIDIKVGNLDCVGTQETGGKCDLPDGMNDGPKRFAESRIFFTIKHHDDNGGENPGDGNDNGENQEPGMDEIALAGDENSLAYTGVNNATPYMIAAGGILTLGGGSALGWNLWKRRRA